MAYGVILGQTPRGSGSNSIRTCRFVVGTSTAGWTKNDCDYLCDGTDDQTEINAAIQALPDTGGEIIILDGTYSITASITASKENTKIYGNGVATVLKRMWNESVGVINVTANYCTIANLKIDGNNASYSSGFGIYISSSNNTITGNTCNSSGNTGISFNAGGNNNTIIGNTCNYNTSGISFGYPGFNNTVTGNTCNYNSNTGIAFGTAGSNKNTITGNTCNYNKRGFNSYEASNQTITGNTFCNNSHYGIDLSDSSNNTITGNTCNDSGCGIHLDGSNNNTITGNTCIRGTGRSSDYNSSQYTIYISGTRNSYNLIADNNLMGKNYVSDGGTSNTFVNNKYN